ncbi:phosphotransferase [Sulfitobacter sp. PR48]|uniref:phosphotransferase enzyme family protein n=1 Tax=Sulfitobacter sp. PR48 TaxID=3028383 RepID=UPI00237B1B78|nr:phosphotransferase [Sulfitobacter sp. PR48]MDD9720755.1 phosphotransferase [Sulfitobacter sp. PR48]
MENCTDPDAAGRQGRAQQPATTQTYFDAASAILALPSGTMEPDISAELLQRHFGLSGKLEILSSEVERTVAVELADGRRLILKTSTRPEARDSFAFQAEAIAGLRGPAGFVVPDILPTLGGGLIFAEDGICGYLQTRLDGVALHQMEATPDLLFRTGSALARLDLALAPLPLPATDRPILWHVGCWPRLMTYAKHLPPGPVAAQVADAMKDYVETIAPQTGDLVWQVTHNDPSPFNMMVTDQALGFIDFGDGCHSPRLQDLAIAASHVVTDPDLLLGGAEYLIAGYASVLPLTALEESLIIGLMRARQSALILINYWRAHLFPDDAAYIKKNVQRAENGLAILASRTAPSCRPAMQAALATLQSQYPSRPSAK